MMSRLLANLPSSSHVFSRYANHAYTDSTHTLKGSQMTATRLLALRRLFRPLANILHEHGTTIGEIIPILKHAYVDAVADSLEKKGVKPTTARIAIQTGLTRKDVAAIRKQEPLVEKPSRYNRVNRVIAGWTRDPSYLDPKGRPAVLLNSGDAPSLSALINQYSGDMPFNSMRDELIDAGAIEERGQGLWELVSPYYLSTNDSEEGLRILGDDVGQLIATIGHNLANEEEPRFQRKVSYNNVPRKHVLEFRRIAAKENQQLLLRLNAWLADHDRDSNSAVDGDDRMRVGVGVYYFEDKVDEDKVDEDSD